MKQAGTRRTSSKECDINLKFIPDIGIRLLVWKPSAAAAAVHLFMCLLEGFLWRSKHEFLVRVEFRIDIENQPHAIPN